MALYRQYCDGMFVIANRYMKDATAAEDAMQDAFIKAFSKNFSELYTYALDLPSSPGFVLGTSPYGGVPAQPHR